MPRKIFAFTPDEINFPQFTIWEDGSWYRSWLTQGVPERACGGPLFGTPELALEV